MGIIWSDQRSACAVDASTNSLPAVSPTSLSRVSRVAVRRSLGPGRLAGSALPSLGLPAHILAYLTSVLDLCKGEAVEAVKRKAVEGITIVRPMMVER